MKKRTGKMISLSLAVAMAMTAAPVTALAVDEPVQKASELTIAQNEGETGTDTTTVDTKEEEEPATVVAAPVVDEEVEDVADASTYEADNTIEIHNSAELVEAIKKQQDGQTWELAAGEYNVYNEDGVLAGTYDSEINGETGFAFPITANNLTIKAAAGAEGKVTITSSYHPDAVQGGVWHNQNFITVASEGVTIEGVNLKGNPNDYEGGQCNKVIELVDGAKDFTLSNVDLLPIEDSEGKVFSGSIYINVADPGKTVIENVTLYSWINARAVTTKEVEVNNVTIDFTNNTYSGVKGFTPSVSGDNVNTDNLTIKVDSSIDSTQLFNENMADGATIELTDDITMSETANITKDITIDGKGHTISGKNITSTASRIDGFLVEDGTATFKNLTLTDFDEDLTAPYGSVIKIDNGDENAKVIAENVEISKFVREAFSFKAGTFEINNCKIDCAPDENRPNVLTKGVQVGFNSGTDTVKGTIRNTEITNSASNYAEWDSAAIELFNNADVEIDGCTISQCTTGIHVDNYWVGSTSYPTYTGDVKASIKNTSITAEENAVRIYSREDQEDHKASVTIESGDFTGAVKIVDGTDEDSITISGGQFKESGDISDFIAPGSNLKPDGNGGFTVSKKSSGGSHKFDNYITIITPKNGEVSVSDDWAYNGDKVTLTVTPDKGYEVDKIEIVDAEGNKLEAKKVDDKDNEYTFKVKNSDVTVTVTFKEEGKTTEDTDKEEGKDEETTETPETTELNFTDVKESDWFFKGVEYVVDKGIMSGVSENEFAPSGKLTRAMLVQMLYNMESRPACDAENAFMDVPVGQWYTDAVIWANDAKIVSGMGEGLFAPNMEITREQMVAMLYNYAKYKGYDVTASADLSAFADTASVSTWAQPAMQWAVAEGYISGMGDNQLAPQGTATRAEIASVIMRFMEATAESAETAE